jgi:hypothetical protein
MLAESRNVLLLAITFGHKFDAIVVPGAIANLALNSDWGRGIRRSEFHDQMIARIQFGSRKHPHPSVAERECSSGNNRSFGYIAHNYPDRDVDFVPPPAARVQRLDRVCECVSQGLPAINLSATFVCGFNFSIAVWGKKLA